MMQRSYKFRIYPNQKQRYQLVVEFGVARFIWNAALAARRDAYQWYGQKHNYVSMNRAITELKTDPDYAWINQATRQCGTQALIDLDAAYRNFFDGRARYPRFKKRSHKQSVRHALDQRSDNFKPGAYIKIPKLGAVKVRWSRIPTGRPKMVTISKDSVGSYWISFSCEEHIAPIAKAKQSVVGVDMGVKDTAVTSDGFYSGNPKHTYRLSRQLKLAQRKLSRRQKGSGRWHGQRKKVARIHRKIVRCRNDHLHKLSHKLVAESHVICIEDLNVAGMVKNRRLSKVVTDSSMSELRRQIDYKAAWYGRQVVVVDRWFPSSKTCSSCGSAQDMPLSVREFNCECGLQIDRDLNAALNIKAAGVSSLNVEGETLLDQPLAA